MKLNINEATLPDWKDSIIEEVKNVLNNNRLYGSVYEDKDFSTDNSFMLCVEIIDGDWKHDHARTNYTITTLLDNYDNIEVTNLGEEVIGEETDGDWYSAIHKYMIIRYEDEEDFDECYLPESNDNTEEQELAEFLDWLKQEKIPVANVNKKFKMIHLQNPKDLDMASWYLHDRDYFKKLADFGWMVGAPSSAGKKVANALKMESNHKRINEHTYRVWYRPYGLDEEEDYIDVTASNEDEAIRFARTCGYTTDVELLESKQLNEDETSDIENALQNFIDYNSNKNLDRIQKRIACTTEFDNGHVMHGDWQRIPVIDAELMAKEKSLKNPDKTYYVQYDDLMIGSSDLQWKNGQLKTW